MTERIDLNECTNKEHRPKENFRQTFFRSTYHVEKYKLLLHTWVHVTASEFSMSKITTAATHQRNIEKTDKCISNVWVVLMHIKFNAGVIKGISGTPSMVNLLTRNSRRSLWRKEQARMKLKNIPREHASNAICCIPLRSAFGDVMAKEAVAIVEDTNKKSWSGHGRRQ